MNKVENQSHIYTVPYTCTVYISNISSIKPSIHQIKQSNKQTIRLVMSTLFESDLLRTLTLEHAIDPASLTGHIMSLH